ncbi:123aa long hypothetical protein [Pyrococcus horikoshii OT3]|uniref:Uncharacterized protein n=1 Tax=Pyrococcus horikoshii (strain ATCC 700860 / DSM 12428 / JCM 9974 / NBRC 100139 / OT-3) TaxID=70601 RepID=O59411_PYRHO|nr:123aa long hypothetical protein [Pyrococcus horikoshii OT3]
MVLAVPTFSRSTSFLFMGSTLSSCSVPTTLSSRCTSNLRLSQTGGNFPGLPTTFPAMRSPLVKYGSSFVPTPTSPPGYASSTNCPPACRETISVVIGSYLILPCSSYGIPGLISISSPTFNFP